MKFSELFKDIVSITSHDYAGWDDKKGWDNPEFYLNKIIDLENKGVLKFQEFKELVDDYLLDFQDRHMYFLHTNSKEAKNETIGFRVRRYEDALYVTQTIEETRFPVETKIISIEGKTIDSISKLEKKALRENYTERERWESLLNRAAFVEIVNEQNETIIVHLNKYVPFHHESNYTFEHINDDTILLSFSDFENVDKILSVINELILTLENQTNLIIDIRQNYGGNANSISSLLPLIFSEEEKPSSEIKIRKFNCTVRNSDLFIKLCNDSRGFISDENTLRMLEFAEKQFQMYRGQGFVRFDFSEYIKELEREFSGSEYPRKVIILTDCYTASAAEEFVEVCKQSSKVTVIGRSTMGINDYSDLVEEKWNNEYSPYYPISRLEKRAEVHEIHGKGIQPDIYIPWTPEHIKKDIDMMKALELINKERKC